MNIISTPHKLSGKITVPGSKSHTIRALILSALAEGSSKISNPLSSADCLSAANAIPLLGAGVDFGDGSVWTVKGAGKDLHLPDDVVNVGNSGSLLYFLSPICSTFEGTSVFTGDASIRKRPVFHVADVIKQMGADAWCAIPGSKTCPLVVRGKADGKNVVKTEGSISSQYITGMMMAALRLPNGLTIELSDPKETPYLTMTKVWLEEFGATVQMSDDFKKISVTPPAKFVAKDFAIPSDWEGVAFPLIAALLTDSKITIENVDLSGSQGDDKIVEVLRSVGADIAIDKEKSTLTVTGGKPLSARNLPDQTLRVPISGFPDAICALAVAACFIEGKTIIEDAAVCRRKETDRISTLKVELEKAGAKIEEGPDYMVIHGGQKMHGAKIQSHDDHRIAMAAACLGLALDAGQEIEIVGAECAAVSFPRFYELMNGLGCGFTEK
ncbi:MAG: 3-phosphoshikimate 1-carboxyvinyltransferase [Treponema sp.]|nr:3-phosphoshikimate 1-carboxyvinyltransferase [Treponema sp.]